MFDVETTIEHEGLTAGVRPVIGRGQVGGDMVNSERRARVTVTPPRDRGCASVELLSAKNLEAIRYSDSCLQCPLPRCREELDEGRLKQYLKARAVGVRLGEGMSQSAIAELYGWSLRTVQRIQAWRSTMWYGDMQAEFLATTEPGREVPDGQPIWLSDALVGRAA